MISPRFIKRSLIYTVAGSLPLASAVLLLPLYVNNLSPATYGVLALCLAFTNFIQIVVGNSFDSAIYIHYHEFRQQPRVLAELVSASFLFMLVLAGVAGLLLGVAAPLIIQSMGTASMPLSLAPYGWLAFGVGVCQAIVKVHGHLLQIREKAETYLWANLALFSIIVITSVWGLRAFPETLWGPLGGRLLGGGLLAIWALIRIFREFGFHFVSPWRYTSVRFHLFTFGYQCQQWAVNYFDRFVILFFMPLSTVGMYDFAVKCLVPVELLLNGLSASINPQVVRRISEQGERKEATPEINRYFYGLIATIVLAVAATITGVPWAARFLISEPHYLESLYLLPLLAPLLILRAMRSYLVLPFSVVKRMETLTMAAIGIAVVKFVWMAVLLPRLGVTGVVVASAISLAIEWWLLHRLLQPFYITRFNAAKLLGVPLFLTATMWAAFGLLSHLPLWVLGIGYGAVALLTLAVVYRNEWPRLWRLPRAR